MTIKYDDDEDVIYVFDKNENNRESKKTSDCESCPKQVPCKVPNEIKKLEMATGGNIVLSGCLYKNKEKEHPSVFTAKTSLSMMPPSKMDDLDHDVLGKIRSDTDRFRI